MKKQTIDSILDKILANYYERYNKIFEVFDFSSKRFTEENQTVNFCNAVQSICKDSVVWYEYPWKNGKKQGNQKSSSSRYDAVVYLPEEKALLIVESKCLRGNESKYTAMHSDLKRIIDNKNINPSFASKTVNCVYAVILADYWKRKAAEYYKNVNTAWVLKDKNDIKIKEKSSSEPLWSFFELASNKLKNPKWNCNEGLRKNYCLCTMIGELN